MSKVLAAMAAAGLCLGINSATAQNVKSALEKEWGQFQTLLQKCPSGDPVANAKCVEDAKAFFLASDFKCESFIGQDKEQCLEMAEVWRKAPPAAALPAERRSAGDQIPESGQSDMPAKQ